MDGFTFPSIQYRIVGGEQKGLNSLLVPSFHYGVSSTSPSSHCSHLLLLHASAETAALPQKPSLPVSNSVQEEQAQTTRPVSL